MKKRYLLFPLVFILLICLYFFSRTKQGESLVAVTDTIDQETQTTTENKATKKSAVKVRVQDSFDALTSSVLETLPTQSEVRNSKSGIHDTPIEILKASEKISQVEDEMKKDESHVSKGIEFLYNCAKLADRPNSIRSVCLRKAWTWAKNTNFTTASDMDIPEEIKNLARYLPEN